MSGAGRQQEHAVLRRRHDRVRHVGVPRLLREGLVHEVRVRDDCLLHVDQLDGVLKDRYIVV